MLPHKYSTFSYLKFRRYTVINSTYTVNSSTYTVTSSTYSVTSSTYTDQFCWTTLQSSKQSNQAIRPSNPPHLPPGEAAAFAHSTTVAGGVVVAGEAVLQ